MGCTQLVRYVTFYSVSEMQEIVPMPRLFFFAASGVHMNLYRARRQLGVIWASQFSNSSMMFYADS